MHTFAATTNRNRRSCSSVTPDSAPLRPGQPADLARTMARTMADVAYGQGILAQVKNIVGPYGLHALINNAAIQIQGGADSLPVPTGSKPCTSTCWPLLLGTRLACRTGNCKGQHCEHQQHPCALDQKQLCGVCHE